MYCYYCVCVLVLCLCMNICFFLILFMLFLILFNAYTFTRRSLTYLKPSGASSCRVIFIKYLFVPVHFILGENHHKRAFPSVFFIQTNTFHRVSTEHFIEAKIWQNLTRHKKPVKKWLAWQISSGLNPQRHYSNNYIPPSSQVKLIQSQMPFSLFSEQLVVFY